MERHSARAFLKHGAITPTVLPLFSACRVPVHGDTRSIPEPGFHRKPKIDCLECLSSPTLSSPTLYALRRSFLATQYHGWPIPLQEARGDAHVNIIHIPPLTRWEFGLALSRSFCRALPGSWCRRICSFAGCCLGRM
ncbi:hypothetical protein BJX96DRAFT_86821 [Aspergillus floccosus]